MQHDASQGDQTTASGHPAVAGREGALGALADEVRRLVALTVTNTAGQQELGEITALLRAASTRLEASVPDVPIARFAMPADRPAAPDVDFEAEPAMGASMPYDFVIGRFNPLALPVAISFEPPLAVGTGIFTTPYEGAPGCVHGAALAATFDIILTAANHLAGAAGPTVRLTLTFRRPTLIDVPCRFESEVTEVSERRVSNRGRLLQGGVVTVEAEGRFAILDTERIRSLAKRRLER